VSKQLLLLPGDGIGPEVVGAARRVIDQLNSKGGLDIAMEEALIGGISIDACGYAIDKATLERASTVDAVLLGAVGGPKWVTQPYDRRPEAGILALRAGMRVFANLRPAILYSALAAASSLKAERIKGLNILIVRELTGGVYFGEPRGIETLINGERRGLNTHCYTSSEIVRVARVAFEAARRRRNKVCSVEKSNVMETGLLWRQEVQKLHDSEYPDVTLSHMLADACAMELLKNPRQFDVILTDNLFGDILSDEAAMLTGSLGMLPSASLGALGRPGLYEPIHGSAPDIAGKGIANPSGTILSLAMALRYSLGRSDLAERIEQAVGAALDPAVRTPDLRGGKGTTATMTDAIVKAL
jgi:3-isopropylmalate dehydrogenase